MIAALEALARLREGNRRFVENESAASAALNSARRVADDIENLARTVGSETEDRAADRTPVTRSGR